MSLKEFILLCVFGATLCQSSHAEFFRYQSQRTPDSGEQLEVDSFRLLSLLGANVVRGEAGLASGAQLAISVSTKVPLYFSFEGSFALFSVDRPTSMMLFLVGGFYEFMLSESATLSGFVGGLGGLGVLSRPTTSNTGQLLFLPQNPVAIYLELGLAQKLDELVSLRAQFRPGVLDGNVGFMMNFNVQFRYL